MNQKERLSIIIITFNSEKQISDCLRSVFHSTINNKIILEVVLIDNGSSDNTVSNVKRDYKHEIVNGKIKLFVNKKNVGFAKAVNQGINLSKGSYFLLLNPDVFVHRKTIGDVLSFMQEKKFGIVGVKTANKKGLQNGSYFRIPNLQVGIFEFTNLGKFLKYDYWSRYFYYKDHDMGNKEVDIVTGGFMLLDKHVTKKVGLFDERFFMYLEDVDYCVRAKSAGFKIGLHDTFVTHIGGASSNNKYKTNHSAWLDSRRKYYLKNFGFFENFVIQPLFLLDEALIKLRLFIRSIR